MEFLTTPTSAYLLQGSLDVLHFESREWQDEVAFMLDEVMFLHKLHRQFMEKIMPEEQRNHSAKLQEKLRLFSTEVQKAQEVINEHERYLAEIIQNKTHTSDEAYREKHKAVKLQIEDQSKEFKQLKKEMFQWVENAMS